jgi:transcription elongation factor GreA
MLSLSPMNVIPFTRKGFEELKKQLENEISKRPEAVRQLTRGREMGDLSENGLYKAAKQELNDIDRQVRFLKNLVKYGKPITPANNINVQIGHAVLVKTQTGEKEFLVVGEYEADPSENKISNKSPLGYNLMGKKVGEEISIKTPKGYITYIIKSIK